MRNVLVTGASRGIGLGIARALVSDGFRVLALARQETQDLGDAIAEARANDLGELIYVPFDLDKLDEVPALIRWLRETHGPLYGLVNNAALGTEGLLTMMAQSEIERLVRLNTLAPIIVTKHALRSMISAGEGRVINMTSIVASTGYDGISVYAATKASLVGFTHSLAREVGTLSITVNAVAPGFVATHMTANMTEAQRATIVRRSALKRMPDIDDIAHSVTYLMSDRAKNVTGTILTVDAGATA